MRVRLACRANSSIDGSDALGHRLEHAMKRTRATLRGVYPLHAFWLLSGSFHRQFTEINQAKKFSAMVAHRA
jgi:hypothetical protein